MLRSPNRSHGTSKETEGGLAEGGAANPECRKTRMVVQARHRLTSETNAAARLLALEIRSRFFGFAVFEGGDIIDWGIRGFVPGRTGRKAAMKKFVALLKLYAPPVSSSRGEPGEHVMNHRDARRFLRVFRREVECRSTAFVIVIARKYESTSREVGSTINKGERDSSLSVLRSSIEASATAEEMGA